MKLALTLGAVLGVSALPALALAQDARTHDGLYVRLGAGVAYFSDSAESDPLPLLGGTVQATATAGGPVLQGGVGGTVAPGLIIGGRWLFEMLPGPTATNVQWRDTNPGDFEFDFSTFHVLSPFVDYYFDPDKGMHVQGNLGLAILALGDGRNVDFGNNVEGQTAFGLGFGAGFGYEWWLSDTWSGGVLGELHAAWLGGTASASGSTDLDWSHFVISPSVSFAATMN
jgi:hypothetical protein